MLTSYSEEVLTPKTAKVKFVKPSTSSTPIMVFRTLQVREATRPPVPIKDSKILPSRSQSQSDLTLNEVESQAYSGLITRLRAKELTYYRSDLTILGRHLRSREGPT